MREKSATAETESGSVSPCRDIKRDSGVKKDEFEDSFSGGPHSGHFI